MAPNLDISTHSHLAIEQWKCLGSSNVINNLVSRLWFKMYSLHILIFFFFWKLTLVKSKYWCNYRSSCYSITDTFGIPIIDAGVEEGLVPVAFFFCDATVFLCLRLLIWASYWILPFKVTLQCWQLKVWRVASNEWAEVVQGRGWWPNTPTPFM